MIIKNTMGWLRQRAATIAIFSYGIVIGTSAPFILARCSTSGACGNCGVFCSVGFGILPLVLFLAAKSRVNRAGLHIISRLRKRLKLTG